MELNFSLFLSAVGVNVLHFHDLWNVLDNLHQFLNLIHLNDINYFLLHELSQLGIDL